MLCKGSFLFFASQENELRCQRPCGRCWRQGEALAPNTQRDNVPGCSGAIPPLIRATSRTKIQMYFRSSSQEKKTTKTNKKHRDFVRANHKAVPVTCKAQVLPPWTHLSSGEQQAPAHFQGGLVTQRKQNHSPPAPQGLGSLSHPSDPTCPRREARSRVSARCPPRGGRCLCPIPCRRVRKNTETTRALPKARRTWAGARDGAWGHCREAKGSARERGWREEAIPARQRHPRLPR